MADVTYKTESLIAGDIKTQQVAFAADTYYRGMPLEYDSGNDRYQYLASGTIAGFFLGEQTTLTNGDRDSIIVGGDIYQGGVVNDSGAAYTVTEDLIALWAQSGFYVKRK